MVSSGRKDCKRARGGEDKWAPAAPGFSLRKQGRRGNIIEKYKYEIQSTNTKYKKIGRQRNNNPDILSYTYTNPWFSLRIEGQKEEFKNEKQILEITRKNSRILSHLQILGSGRILEKNEM